MTSGIYSSHLTSRKVFVLPVLMERISAGADVQPLDSVSPYAFVPEHLGHEVSTRDPTPGQFSSRARLLGYRARELDETGRELSVWGSADGEYPIGAPSAKRAWCASLWETNDVQEPALMVTL